MGALQNFLDRPSSVPARRALFQVHRWLGVLTGVYVFLISVSGAARRRAPGQHVARVVLPSSARAAVLVMFSPVQPTPAGSADLTSVYLDQYTGEVLTAPAATRRSAGDVIMAWVAPLHIGNFAGNGVRVAWLILGLSPGLLFATGFAMWWTRVVRHRQEL